MPLISSSWAGSPAPCHEALGLSPIEALYGVDIFMYVKVVPLSVPSFLCQSVHYALIDFLYKNTINNYFFGGHR